MLPRGTMADPRQPRNEIGFRIWVSGFRLIGLIGLIGFKV